MVSIARLGTRFVTTGTACKLYHVSVKLTQGSGTVFGECTRAISASASVSRRSKPDRFDDAFFDREFEKAKDQMDPDLDDPMKIIKKMDE